jgi:hypothetical protein
VSDPLLSLQGLRERALRAAEAADREAEARLQEARRIKAAKARAEFDALIHKLLRDRLGIAGGEYLTMAGADSHPAFLAGVEGLRFTAYPERERRQHGARWSDPASLHLCSPCPDCGRIRLSRDLEDLAALGRQLERFVEHGTHWDDDDDDPCPAYVRRLPPVVVTAAPSLGDQLAGIVRRIVAEALAETEAGRE